MKNGKNMLKRRPYIPRISRTSPRAASTESTSSPRIPPLIEIKDATFYRHHPSARVSAENNQETAFNQPLFPNLNFFLPSFAKPEQHWAIVGPASTGKSAFFQILRGQLLCVPPTARSYPYLATEDIAKKGVHLRNPSNAIQYVGFDRGGNGGLGAKGTRGAYISARYESRTEETDFSLLDYLTGRTELNAAEDLAHNTDMVLLEQVTKDLNLQSLLDMPLSNLSNGQTRRARIAKALLGKPEVLLLDEAFSMRATRCASTGTSPCANSSPVGLDPLTQTTLSPLLHELSRANSPRLILSLRPQDPIPDWITHMMYVRTNARVEHQGLRDDVLEAMRRLETDERVEDTTLRELGRILTPQGVKLHPAFTIGLTAKHRTTRDGFPTKAKGVEAGRKFTHGEPLVEMSGVKVSYGQTTALGDWKQLVEPGTMKEGLHWTVRQGSRWGIFGPNGSGKTTLLSLLTSDHPQSYSQPIKIFGRSRLPTLGQPGISIFDIQSRIGHSSPEVHALFPKHLSVRRSIESAWADAPLSKPRLTFERDEKVDACLRWFRSDLNPTSSLSPSSPATAAAILSSSLSRSSSSSRENLENELSTWGIDEFDEATYRANSSKYDSSFAHAYHDTPTRQFYSNLSVEWADDVTFGSLHFGAQRLVLLLRAMIAEPDIIVLDEAFSGMDIRLRDKANMFLTFGDTKVRALRVQSWKNRHQKTKKLQEGETIDHKPLGFYVQSSWAFARRLSKIPALSPKQALLVVSHVPEEIPGIVREWVCLPEPGTGEPARFGRLDVPLEGPEKDHAAWRSIWGVEEVVEEEEADGNVVKRVASGQMEMPAHWHG